MSRRTKKQKQRAALHHRSTPFPLRTPVSKSVTLPQPSPSPIKPATFTSPSPEKIVAAYLIKDLTKTGLVCAIILALEISLYFYFK